MSVRLSLRDEEARALLDHIAGDGGLRSIADKLAAVVRPAPLPIPGQTTLYDQLEDQHGQG